MMLKYLQSTQALLLGRQEKVSCGRLAATIIIDRQAAAEAKIAGDKDDVI